MIGVVVVNKVFPDGREELIRQVVLTGLFASSLREIVVVSEDLTHRTIQFRPGSP